MTAMTPDDPRHGTYAGYVAHIGGIDRSQPCDPCALAGYRRRKHNRYLTLIGTPAMVPMLGTLRRIRALRTIGWTVVDISRASGIPEKTLRNPNHRGEYVYRGTADAVAAAYEQMCMTFPEGGYATRQRRHAARMKWAPPLAWDCIDTDTEPTGVSGRTKGRPHDEIDEAIVQRLASGRTVEGATVAEKFEAMRRWLAAGGSETELCRIQRWKSDRYTPARAAA